MLNTSEKQNYMKEQNYNDFEHITILCKCNFNNSRYMCLYYKRILEKVITMKQYYILLAKLFKCCEIPEEYPEAPVLIDTDNMSLLLEEEFIKSGLLEDKESDQQIMKAIITFKNKSVFNVCNFTYWDYIVDENIYLFYFENRTLRISREEVLMLEMIEHESEDEHDNLEYLINNVRYAVRDSLKNEPLGQIKNIKNYSGKKKP